MEPILLGLCGQKGCGKDTAAQFINEWAASRGLSFERHSFADKLKHSAMLALGFNVTESDALVIADGLKEMGEITTCIPDQGVLYTITGRKFLQLYGTEAHRDVFGYNFWVDSLLPLGRDPGEDIPDWWSYNFGYAAVSAVADVRFENEAERIRELGGHVIEIVRPGLPQDDHISEKGIPAHMVNRVIRNYDDPDYLKNEVFKAMEEMFGEFL